MTTDTQPATHTPGPWRIDDTYVMSPRFDVIGPMRSSNGDFSEVNARLIVSACNSYDKHCGENAIECAEGDLLGELLEACQTLMFRFGKDFIATDTETAVIRGEVDWCQQIIAKAQRRLP